jgi:hypothetical protein
VRRLPPCVTTARAARFMRKRKIPSVLADHNTWEPDISDNVGPVKSFFEQPSPFAPRSGLARFVHRCIDDHGSLVIFRSVSVRPIHLFDQGFDHDH